MKNVVKQIEFLESLLQKLKKKASERSAFKTSMIPDRVNEAKTIIEGSRFLLTLIKEAVP